METPARVYHGTVDQELLLRNEYLVTENRILRHQLKGRLRLSDGERKTLAVIGQKLGKQALKGVAQIVKPETILGWHRTLVAQKFDGSQQRQSPGRPTIDQDLEALIIRIAQENRSWGYDRRLLLDSRVLCSHGCLQRSTDLSGP